MNAKQIFPAIFFCFLFTSAFAQYDVVRETERMMSFGSRPCFRLEFANTDAGVVESVWKDFAKKNFNAKLKKSKGEWAATKLRSAFMGDNPFAIYSTIEKDGNKTALNVWVDAGTYFLNRRDNRSRTDEMMSSLQQCYFDIRREAIGKELRSEEEKLKDMENRQKKLVRDNESLRKDIENWKSKIQKAEQDIINNEQNQESNIVDQEAQRRLIDEVRRRLENVENEGGK
ncbi:MAG: hypothetical protein JNJ57_00970 [Saprospiraceae bacterium]|nr:hypothetical protein [Saprospiraceae bacterium]